MRRLLPLLVLALAVPLATPAHADWWSAPDPAGDATSYEHDPEPEPCGTVTETRHRVGDLRRLVVRHTRDDVVLTAVMAGLDQVRDPWLTFPLRTERRAWELDVFFGRGGRVQALLLPATRFGEPDECGSAGGVSIGESCSGLTGTADRASGRVQVVVARHCLRDPRWVQAGVESSAGLGRGVRAYDAWEPAARRDDDPFTPTYGPRVLRPGAAR